MCLAVQSKTICSDTCHGNSPVQTQPYIYAAGTISGAFAPKKRIIYCLEARPNRVKVAELGPPRIEKNLKLNCIAQRGTKKPELNEC